MKRLLIAFMLLAGASTTLRAQNVNSSAVSQPVIDSSSFDIVSRQMLRNYYIANGTDSARGERHYQRWQTFWSQRVAKDIPDSIGFLRGTVVSAQLDKELRFLCLGNGYRGDWHCMGPFQNSYGSSSHSSGRIQSIWVDPSNVNYILAASSSGGLWKTTDGGQNWANITDQSQSVITGTMGIGDIAVNPLDHNIIYLTTGTNNMFVSHWNGNYGLGPIYSTDGGQTWQPDLNFRQVAGTLQTQGVGDGDHWVNKMAYEPNTNKLYAISGNRIFRKATVSGTWENITPSLAGLGPDYYFTDFQFTYNPAGKVVFSTTCVGHTQYLVTLNEATQGWSAIPVVIPNYFTPGPGSVGLGISVFGISSSNQAYMGLFLARVSDTVLKNMLYKIDLNTGSNLTAISTNFNGSGFNYNSVKQIVVSPANPDIFYVVQADGGWSHIVMKSTDGGANFSNICGTHSDGRCMVLYHAGTDPGGIDDILFAGTDGGIAKKSAGDAKFHSIVGDGICITQFYGLSTDPTNDAYMTAGAQDNNSQNYNAETTAPWNQPTDGGDGLRPGFANNGVHVSYSQTKSVSDKINKFTFTPGGVASVGEEEPDDNYKSLSFLRRLKFDRNNLARVGYHYIWQKEINDIDWKATFGKYPNTVEPKPWDPKKDIITGKQSIDFIFPESNPDVAYLAYFGTTDTTPTLNDTVGKLFYADDIHNQNGFSWTNITPPLVQSVPLTDIETDPANPNRIWACFGGVQWDQYQGDVPPSLRKKRVFYSDDHGTNWQDMSKGITALPIHKIIYIPGSDDVLFAATDIGVYRWNKSAAQWECFNTGMPRQIVTDIEYIPCSGRLRAATYGRGIWETDLTASQGDYLPGETNIIDGQSNVTWNTSRNLRGSVRIKSGGILNISGATTTIYMPRRAVITVEPGAKLVIDGATITNGCHDCEWGGIALTGNKNQPPLAQYQASLVLKNSATLENAYIAINNYSWDNGARGGGIIDATNSSIRNCWRAVALNGYGSYSYQYQGTASKCRFDHMKFIVDDPEMYGYHGSSDYFTSFDTKGGVEITNSIFTNTIAANGVPENKRGRGIYTLATGLKVQNCTFTGLNEGVHCEGYAGLPTRVVSVFLSDFSNINHNITLAGTAYANIKGNTINTMVLNHFDPDGAYGIYLNQSAGAYVGCHNQVDGDFTGIHLNRYGIIINNNEGRATTIKDNMITNTYVGTQPQQDNTNLIIFCNDYEHNDYAWAINPQSAGGDFTSQGTGCQPPEIRAGNIFKNNQKDILSYAASWSYYAGNGAYEVPAWWAGAMTLNQCTTDENPACNDFANCVYDWTDDLQGQVLSQYSSLKAEGFKMRADAIELYGHIIRGFNYLDETPQLQSFLEAENDDRSRRLLIPLYIQKGMYEEATNTIGQMSLPEEERTAYTDYYNLLINLQQGDRKPDELTPSELTMVQDIAAADLEVSPYAKGYLDWWYKQEWGNPIEPLPQSKGTGEVMEPETPGYVATRLGDAVPNPTSSKTTVDVYIGSRDALKQPLFIIRNTMGRETYRQPLAAGQNHIEVNTGTWEPGIYVYNLLLNNVVSASKKLSVTR